MPLATFHIYSPQDFQKYLLNTQFTRKISMIQNHHTWDPDYASITPENSEMDALEAMRRFHIQVRGWSDIAQNITTFPSGNIGLCRPIDITPAGIFGANHGAICIENLGNFDAGHDVMTQPHKDTITFLNAVLCIKFNLAPVKEQVVYHHWFDRTGQRFDDDKINNNLVGDEQKTCPGTAFFGSNTITSAQANFYPIIENKMSTLKAVAPPPSTPKTVNAGELNVRNGPGMSFSVLRTISGGTKVMVFITQNGWSKISNTAEEWVFSTLLT
jgi:hypothetical protein